VVAPALEYEFELEEELEHEGEFESEEFLRTIGGLARRAVRSPVLRRAAAQAGRAALGAVAGPRAGGAIAGALGGLLREEEWETEGEWEGEWELEGEVNPIRRAYPDALMEHLGHAATETESEAEAEAFIGALVPLATRLLPRAASALTRAAPTLIRGATRVAQTLRSSPTTRPLVRAMPTIVRRAAADIAGQVARGRPVTAQGAARSLARQAQRTLRDPRQCAQAIQRSRALDRRFHRAAGPAASRINTGR
jgi:hypothetical protein